METSFLPILKLVVRVVTSPVQCWPSLVSTAVFRR